MSGNVQMCSNKQRMRYVGYKTTNKCVSRLLTHLSLHIDESLKKWDKMNEQVKSQAKQEQCGSTPHFYAYIKFLPTLRPPTTPNMLDFLVTLKIKSTKYVKNMTSYESKQVFTCFSGYLAGNLLTFDNDASLSKAFHHVNKAKNSGQMEKSNQSTVLLVTFPIFTKKGSDVIPLIFYSACSQIFEGKRLLTYFLVDFSLTLTRCSCQK